MDGFSLRGKKNAKLTNLLRSSPNLTDRQRPDSIVRTVAQKTAKMRRFWPNFDLWLGAYLSLCRSGQIWQSHGVPI